MDLLNNCFSWGPTGDSGELPKLILKVSILIPWYEAHLDEAGMCTYNEVHLILVVSENKAGARGAIIPLPFLGGMPPHPWMPVATREGASEVLLL